MYKKCLLFVVIFLFQFLYAQDKIEIRMMEIIPSPYRTRLLRGMLDEFEKENPNIEVKLISTPWNQAHQKLTTLVVGGSPPDVVEMPEQWLAQFAAMGVLINLESYMNSSEELDHLSDLTLRASKIYRDTPYFLPHGYYIKGLYYREDWFKELNLKPPENFEDFYYAAKKITNSSKNRYGISLRGSRGCWDDLHYVMAGFMGTGKYFDDKGNCILNSPEAVEGIKFYASLYRDGYSPRDSYNWDYNEMVAAFYSGVTGMVIQDPEVIATFRRRMDNGSFNTAKLPVGPEGAFSKLGVAGYSMFKKCRNKKAAWELISFLCSERISMYWSKNNWLLPISKAGFDDPFFSKGYIKPFMDMLKDPDYEKIFHPWHLPQWGIFFERYSTEEFQKMLLGKQTARQMADNITEFLTDAQKEYLKKFDK